MGPCRRQEVGQRVWREGAPVPAPSPSSRGVRCRVCSPDFPEPPKLESPGTRPLGLHRRSLRGWRPGHEHREARGELSEAASPSTLVLKISNRRGAWGAQSVKRPALAQVTISTVRGVEPCVGLCADSSGPGACFGFCVSLSLCPSPSHTLSLSLSKVNKQ